MPLKTFLLLLIGLSSSCVSRPSRPLPEPLIQCKLIVSNESKNSYLYCIKDDGSSWEQRIKLSELPQATNNPELLYVCEPLDSKLKSEEYLKNLNYWVSTYCKE